MARAIKRRVLRPGRKPGSKNPDHDVKKHELAEKLLGAVIEARGRPSLRDLARAADTSIPTINHYFGNRSGAIAAALRTAKATAARYLADVENPGSAKLTASLEHMAHDLAGAWSSFGVGALFSAGMAAGMGDDEAGPGYLDGVLEPTVRALEKRLAVHARRGELHLDPEDELSIRLAALAFISPVLVALLHQHELSGARCRPLDITVLITRHVKHFVVAYKRR